MLSRVLGGRGGGEGVELVVATTTGGGGDTLVVAGGNTGTELLSGSSCLAGDGIRAVTSAGVAVSFVFLSF